MRVFAVAVALRGARARAPGMVHRREKARVHDIVRVKDADGVMAAFLFQHGDHLPQHFPFGMHREGACKDLGARGPRSRLRVVGAVVRDHVNVEQIRRIILREQAFDQMADDRLLVAGRHQHRKTTFGSMFCQGAPPPKGAW